MKTQNDRRKAARDLLNAVREIFSRWDTSGVLAGTAGRDGERLDDEYIMQLSSLIQKNASVSEIAVFLDRATAKSVGLTSDAGRNREFAEQFAAIGKTHRVS
jgi:hypothetical protein